MPIASNHGKGRSKGTVKASRAYDGINLVKLAVGSPDSILFNLQYPRLDHSGIGFDERLKETGSRGEPRRGVSELSRTKRSPLLAFDNQQGTWESNSRQDFRYSSAVRALTL